jgi:hypothetical protein
MLPGALARLHPDTGAPHWSILLNAGLIGVATVVLRFEALLELSMFFYSINAIIQCASVVRLRITHPHRQRPARTMPVPLLLLPVAIAAATLALSPLRNWLVAVGLIVATIVAYALIHLVRRALGHAALGAPPSARAAAAAEALRVAEPADEFERVHTDDGDAWFANLLGGTRRRNQQQAAAEVVQAFELSEFRRGTEDLGSGSDDSDAENGDSLPMNRNPEANPARSAEAAAVAAAAAWAAVSAAPPSPDGDPPLASSEPASGESASGESGDALLLREGEEFVTEVRLDDDDDDGAAHGIIE